MARVNHNIHESLYKLTQFQYMLYKLMCKGGKKEAYLVQKFDDVHR
jgi:hypothetical protein